MSFPIATAGPAVATTGNLVICAVAVPVIYLALVTAGRFIKQRAGVRLGVPYQLLCIALAIWLPLLLYNFYSTPAQVKGATPVETAVPFEILRALRAIVVLLGTVFALALVRRFLWEIHFGQKRQTNIPRFLQELVALVVFAIAVMVVIGVVYEKNVTSLVAGSGIAAVILGLAMQDLLGNVFAGIAIHIGKTFKPGDWLIIDDKHAEVMEVNWRSTRLRNNDHVYLDIPNNHITKSIVINVSYPTHLHALRIRVGVEYAAAPNIVKDALMRAARNAKGVLQSPAPKIFLYDFAESAVTYEVKFWLENHALWNEINDAVRTGIWYELNREKIKIPYPIRTLQVEPRHAGAKKPKIDPDILASLRQQPFFQCLDETQTGRLLADAGLLRFGRGEKIIRQNDEGQSMFVLVCGSGEALITRKGSDVRVGALNAGDCFGEMSLLTGEKRSATIVALNDCEVLEICKPLFAEILHETPALAEELSELLAHRRMENEGILASTAEKDTLAAKQKEYAKGFFSRLSSFFEL